jgi:non-ribosomal peptide synthetase component F
MPALGVHRLIERQSALHGDHIALAGDGTSLTYRELNQRANVVARELIARGLRRGSHVVVRLERSPELAVALLAVLKAGGAYTWIDAADDSPLPYGISVLENCSCRPVVIDPASLLNATRSAPNLPIITRGEDIACALPEQDGLPGVLVPHATIASLHERPVADRSAWRGDASAIDLWLPLMAGATVTVDAAPAHVAAA